MLDVLWVGLAGGLGAACRFVVDGAVRSRRTTGAPLGTLAVNVTGSFIVGVVTGLVLFQAEPSVLALVVGTGFCGGYTTFSAASFESVRLLQDERAGPGLLVIGGNLCGCLAAAALGLLASRL